MPSLLDLIAAMESALEPRVLATVFGTGEDPGPVLRILLDPAPGAASPVPGAAGPVPGAAGPVRAALDGAGARMLERDPGSDLDRYLVHAGIAPGGPGKILLEPLVPRRLPPWLHCCVQAQDRGGATVLATVTAQDGQAPAEAGERFVYDHHNHGLLPMDGRFSLELQRACERARSKGAVLGAGFTFPDGRLEVVLEPLPAAGAQR